MTFYNFLYKLKLLKLTKRKVEKWYRTKNIEKLIFTLENGLYDLRISAAKYLGELGDRRAIPALRISIHDKVKPVSIEACNALKKFTELPEVEKEIEQKLKEWETKDTVQVSGKIKGNTSLPGWKKRDWLAIVKKQLQKPMR